MNDIKKVIASLFCIGTFAHRLGRARKSADSSKRYKKFFNQVDDEVYLSKKLFKGAASARKPWQQLALRRVSPFLITELIAKNGVKSLLSEISRYIPSLM